jgi:hypothetical protein
MRPLQRPVGRRQGSVLSETYLAWSITYQLDMSARLILLQLSEGALGFLLKINLSRPFFEVVLSRYGTHFQ